MIRSILIAALLMFVGAAAHGQQVAPADVIFLTQEWTGDRAPDGRPLVSDDVLNRMAFVSLEEAWGTLRDAGYETKFEGEWEIMHPSRVMVGRALTAAYMPTNPDLEQRWRDRAREEGRRGGMNHWPIEMLQPRDVYVADGFGKIDGGTLIGDNLGQAVFRNSGNGVVFYGSARDLSGLREIDGFNAWVKAWHPSAIRSMMLTSINGPTRIGEAVAMPGDVVLATEGGVLFIPPHLAERVLLSSEVTRLADRFRKQRIAEGRYTLGETYGVAWTTAIDDDFYEWLASNRAPLQREIGVGASTIERMLETRSRDWERW